MAGFSPQGDRIVARRRSHYSQEKRGKEIARQKKSQEKLKRRQDKAQEEGSAEHQDSAEEPG
jgi:hypothetical protein